MMKYVAFLRGINVGGKTVVKMEELRKVFLSLGFTDVKTYIQSGNALFETEERDAEKLRVKIEKAVEENFFKTPVMIRSINEIQKILDNNPFSKEPFEDKLFHVVFLAEPLPAEKAKTLLARNNEKETFAAVEREIYCLLRQNVSDSLLGKKFIEKNLQVASTARNLRTLRKLTEIYP